MRPLVPVILCGGSGTRLWPVSRELRPKQFLSLVGERTMLQDTYLRTLGLGDRLRRPIVVCNEQHRFLAAEQMREVGAEPQAIVLEPVGRNTAPAVAVAAWLALGTVAGDEARRLALPSGSEGQRTSAEGTDDPLLVVLPADHVIADRAAFAEAVQIAGDAAALGYLVTFGIVPERPETGYGYLLKGEPGDDSGRWHHLERFVEKPDRATAEEYVRSGRYLWNSGMFVFSARRYLEELEQHAPAIAAAARQAAAEANTDEDFTRLGSVFVDCPSDSIDYAVMEKTRNAAVVPLDAGWSDVGSWPALHDILDKDSRGNVVRGNVIADDCTNCYIAAASRLVAVIGAQDFVVVETADAVLVMPRAEGQGVKRVVDVLKAEGRAELKKHAEDGAAPAD